MPPRVISGTVTLGGYFCTGPGQTGVSGRGGCRRRKGGITCQNRKRWLEEGGRKELTHHPQAAVAENRAAQSAISVPEVITKPPLLLIHYSDLHYIQLFNFR